MNPDLVLAIVIYGVGAVGLFLIGTMEFLDAERKEVKQIAAMIALLAPVWPLALVGGALISFGCYGYTAVTSIPKRLKTIKDMFNTAIGRGEKP